VRFDLGAVPMNGHDSRLQARTCWLLSYYIIDGANLMNFRTALPKLTVSQTATGHHTTRSGSGVGKIDQGSVGESSSAGMSGGKPKPKSMGMPKPHPSHMSSPGESPGESAAHTGKQGKLSAYANTFSTSSLPPDTPSSFLRTSHTIASPSHTQTSHQCTEQTPTTNCHLTCVPLVTAADARISLCPQAPPRPCPESPLEVPSSSPELLPPSTAIAKPRATR